MFNLTNAANGGNIVFSFAGITGLSGAVQTFSTANAIQYCVKGIAISPKAAITGAAVPTVDVAKTAFNGANTAFTALQLGQAALYVFTLDASGNVGVAQGPVSAYTDTSANSTPLNFPALPDTVTPFAYVVVKNLPTATGQWLFGTNPWNQTGIVIDTPVNVNLLPATDPITA